MSLYFYHGIQDNSYGLETLLKIIATGGIKPKNKRKDNFLSSLVDTDLTFNGKDYVSLCKKVKPYEKDEYTAFNAFIYKHFCFVIDGVEAIKPTIVDGKYDSNYRELIKLVKEDERKRYTDLEDEWQYKGEIPLSKIIAVGIPFSYVEERINCFFCAPYLRSYKKLLDIAKEMNWNIIDTEDVHFIEKYEASRNKDKTIV